MIQPRVRASFDAQGLMRTLRAELMEADAGTARIEAPIDAAVSQQHGYAHAGMTFALADSAAGYAALSVMPEGAEVLTVEMKINLLAPAAGTRLRAVGRVVRAGRRLVIVSAEAWALSGGEARQVALLQGTMIPA